MVGTGLDPAEVEAQSKLLFSAHRSGTRRVNLIWEKQSNMVQDQWRKVAEDLLLAGLIVVEKVAQDAK